MLKWFSGEEGEPGSEGPGSPRGAAGGGEVAVEEMSERLAQTEQLVSQLKELIREKDAALRSKDDQLRVEKEACEAKLSKLRLQNKAKVTSLTSQLEELRKTPGQPGTPTHGKKGSSEGGGEQASRGKIVLLKRKVEELEQQLAQRDGELANKVKQLESQQQRGAEIDAMLTEKDKRLAEKEAYIVHLQMGLAGDQPTTHGPTQQLGEDSGAMEELQLLVQSLTKKVGEAEERYSLLQEQTDSLKELLATEKEQYSQKESMFKQNIQTFKDIIIQKDAQLMEINQMHEQELFKLAAKSDASADLEQLLKALKQKLHEKEEVLLGKTQVIDVLQGEVDGRDQRIKELTERLHRLQLERENLESKMEAEKHVMRAQLRDLMEKQQMEVQRVTEQHQAQMDQVQQDLLGQLEELRRASLAAPTASQEASASGNLPTDSASVQRMAELEAQAKQKTEEANRSEAKFLKMKAWSKTRIRQLEEELRKSQAGVAPPDLTALRSRITDLEEEREENQWKMEQYGELRAKNEMLEAKLVLYEEQQRTLQADLEQFTKRAASQASESGSADDIQSQVLEWQEMVTEAVSARDRAREEKAAMVLRINNMEEEREVMATRQQELEEDLAQARGLGQHKAKKLGTPAQRSLQEDFEFDGQASFQDPRSTSESTTPMEGENMGGWWPEYSTPDTDGLRSVVEELELERNHLQEQILSLEEHCQDLEDRLQLQARIESLQNESEKLQSQLASVRSQQSREAEKHQLLVNSLNEQLKGLSDTQECLESSLIEKENTLAKTSEKLELISSLRESLSEKETEYKELSDRLLQTEHTLENMIKKGSSSEKQCSELKTEVADLTQKLSVLKEKAQKQEATIETLQVELDQTNEDLDKLNTAHLEERAQLIHDLQSCEREIDSLKDILLEKDKEISSLAGNMAEYAEQITVLKQEIKLKEENLVQVENALSKAEREAMVIRDSQNSDQQTLNSKITELVGKLKDTESELVNAREERESKVSEVEHLIKQAEDDKKTIQDLRGEIHKQIVSHRNHLSECETHITSLKEQLTGSAQRLEESEGLVSQLRDADASKEKLQQELADKEQTYEKELKSSKEEQNKLLAQVEKYNGQVQTLTEQLQEQMQKEERIREAVQEKLEAVASLEDKLKAADKRAEDERQKFSTELQVCSSENDKLSSDLKSKSESISKLKSLLKSMKTEKLQLEKKLKGLNEELDLQKQEARELNEKVSSAVELNRSLEVEVRCLTQQKESLEGEVTEHVKHISELTAQMESLQGQISALETQRSENDDVIQELQRGKEELTARNSELSRVLEQSSHSNSQILLAKTNECSSLNQLLRVKEEEVTGLQQRVQGLTSEVEQLQLVVPQKEQTAADLLQKVQTQQSLQTQLEETLSSLKRGLMERDVMLKEKQEECDGLQSEIITQRKLTSKLQADADSLQGESSQLRQQLEERGEMLRSSTQQSRMYKDELDERNETVKSLSDQISAMEESGRKLQSEAEARETDREHLNSRIQVLTEEKHKLLSACQSKENELAQQVETVSELNRQLTAAEEQESSFREQFSRLTEDKQRLQEELAKNSKSASELTSERSFLQEKASKLEIQISDSQNMIDGLMREKEELKITADELKKILKESEESNSSSLLEKTSECANLSKTLQEKAEELQGLQESLTDRDSQLEAQQNQLVQLQDTISMLQEQGSVLKSGLMEKDSAFQQKVEECSAYQKEALLQKELLSKMQGEVESLRLKCSESKQQIEQKDQALAELTNQFQHHQEELNKRNESVISLSSQLGAMNEKAAEMEAEITGLQASVQGLAAERQQLEQEEDQRKVQIVGFTASVQALNEQNTRLKCDLQKTATELSDAQELIANLKAEVRSKETLNVSVQEKEDALTQQESLIQQLHARISEQAEQLKHRADDNVGLQQQVSELEEAVCGLRARVESLTSESCSLRDTLEKKELQYQAKEAQCESLKEQVSHLEESVSKLSNSLQAQLSEADGLKRAVEEKEVALLEQSKSVEEIQRRVDEASLFKSQFMESTELVSQLQGQVQLKATESEDLKRSAGEIQSAFNNLQDKYASALEEVQDVRKQLSQRSDEASHLHTLLDESNRERQTAKSTAEALRNELSDIQDRLKTTEASNCSLAQEKDEAFASHQASVSLLTVELERLKSQHLQVVAQMNALTENLEQREMALHAINSQYSAQAKHASQLLAEMQKVEEQNKRLSGELRLSKEEHHRLQAAVSEENTHLQGEVRKLVAEKEELERRHREVWATQVQMEHRSSSMKQVMDTVESEKQSLQAKVSAKDEEVCRLRENIQKIEQILQDSEKEWLLVLDREKQERSLLAEQLGSFETEMKSKDVKVNALKQDLDSLQEKLAEASAAVRRGSDQLSAKELEASASRIQLEKVLATIQEKESENHSLHQALKTVEDGLQRLLRRRVGAERDSSAPAERSAAPALQDMMQRVQESHEAEVEALKSELAQTAAHLQKILNEGERNNDEQSQRIALLQKTAEGLQTQLHAQVEKTKEASIKCTSLHTQVTAKEEQISSMSIHMSQQKELLSGLSQQLKDKDASIAQVMESASNERMKLGEENISLLTRLESTQQALQASVQRLAEVSEQLEEQTARSQRENSEKLKLSKVKDELRRELAKVSKEKEAMKKKLQAALVVRKDLLRRIDEYEKQREESVNDKGELSALQDRLHEAEAAAHMHEQQVSLLEKQILLQEKHKAEAQRLVEELESEKRALRSTLDGKEVSLCETLQIIREKDSAIEQLQSTEEAFKQERSGLMLRLEELQGEIKTCKEELKDQSSSAELSQMKLEKATLQKKAQAALLARKETMKKAQESEKKLTQELAELKVDYKALLEQHCQQTNELNAIQLSLDEKLRELAGLRQSSSLEELNTLRQLVEERDRTLQDLKTSLAEKESLCLSLSHLQVELEDVTSRFEKTNVEMANKDEALREMEGRHEALKSELHVAQSDLEKAHAEIQEKTEVIEKYEETSKSGEAFIDKNTALEAQRNHILMQENEPQSTLKEGPAVASVQQESLEMLNIQRTRLSEDNDAPTKELEEAQMNSNETQRELDSLKQEQDNSVRLTRELREEITVLSQQLKESEERRCSSQEDGVCAEEGKLGERDQALMVSQAQLSQREELIAALELQLQQQIKMHEVTVEQMRAEAEVLQKSQEDGSRVNNPESQNKITVLTRKLQAALVSRKDLLKENSTLKEELEKLSERQEVKEADYSDLKSSVLNLESSVSSVIKQRDDLSCEVERILNENHSLSAACDSLKLTIESITQQKQAFSCQLESLKDSQTEELSKWKLKHAELKQEYESLLQAYENVSSEMDKMRQLLEGAKRDRQEALRKIHSHGAEVAGLEKQARELEQENDSIKERMHEFAKEQRQRVEELEEENQKIRKELAELDGNHEMAMLELRDKNQQLEAEISQFGESSEALRVQLAQMQAENGQLAERLAAAGCSMEEKTLESNAYANSMQFKLDEALGLNNSLTAQIEAQKTELGAQLEINNLLQKEKQSLCERMERMQNDHELQLGKKDDAMKELKAIIDKHSQESISLNEKVRILEDDKSLLQEELENAQEVSHKVKNENEYLETVILKTSERIDELTESVGDLQTQNSQLSAQLAASKETSDRVRQEKEQEQLKLVRELEQKLKTVQRGSEGSKNVKRELQELLKEKHREINQLQQTCITYQEVILDLESSLKLLEKELKKSSEKISAQEERNEQVEAELISHKNLLQEAKEKIVSVETERDRLAFQVSQQKKQSETTETTKSPHSGDETQRNSYTENQFVFQQQVDELRSLKDRESQRVDELMQQLDSKELQINSLKRAAETNEAKMSALSATPQGADAIKRWNELYQRSLHEKDKQLLEQGLIITRFLEEMRKKDAELNEARVTKSRVERTVNEYSVAAAAQQRQLFVLSATNAELSEAAELLTVQLQELGAQVERNKLEKDALNQQLADKQDVISQLQLHLQQMEKMSADAEAQLGLLQTRHDKLQADFEKQEGLSLQLKTLLQGKDAEISALLSCKDGQMSGYLEQLQANYRTQVSVYEDRLTSFRYQREKADKELRSLEGKVKSLQIQVSRSVQEKQQMAAKMESFKNTLVSSQSERERLVSECRMLEAKSQSGLKGREGSPEGEGGASKGLKHEIRKLLHQMDDLNSENAMLRAQLVRYREDLNQVLSLKDNQLKVLLKKQQDVIKNLENHKVAAEKQHRESRLELQKEEEASSALKAENSKLKAQVSKLEDEMLTQKEERASTSEGRVIADLQEAVAAKAAECSDLQQKLLCQRVTADELKGKMQVLETETDKKLGEAEDTYNAELDKFEREVQAMRNERETADQRASELAKELLGLEQQLSEAKSQSKEVKAQNESLCKAMAALQNDRDQLIEDFKVLRNRYDEELRESRAAVNKAERGLQDASSDSAMFATERDILAQRLRAVESRDAPAELSRLLDDLSKAQSEKEGELKRVVLENTSYGRQLSAFSRSMASLQNERDRLLEELAGARRGSSPETVASTNLRALEAEKDGLVRRQKADELQQTVHKEARSHQEEPADLRSEAERKDPQTVKQETAALAAQGGLEEVVSRLDAERIQLHRDLQRCIYEIQQRDLYLQQINSKLQQAVEEKGSVAAQLRSVSQTLRDTQNRCHWLEGQTQGQTQQGSVYTEVAPGAPQERNDDSMMSEPAESSQLRERLLEVELSLAEEKARREAAEEALRLAEDRAKRVGSSLSRDFSIEMETEEEWEALTLNPNQPLITRKVKGGMVACRRWLRGRSLYFSRLLTSRARSRYFFLAYLLTIHVLVFMCLAGAL